jgi:hypothetical protein
MTISRVGRSQASPSPKVTFWNKIKTEKGKILVYNINTKKLQAFFKRIIRLS